MLWRFCIKRGQGGVGVVAADWGSTLKKWIKMCLGGRVGGGGGGGGGRGGEGREGGGRKNHRTIELCLFPFPLVYTDVRIHILLSEGAMKHREALACARSASRASLQWADCVDVSGHLHVDTCTVCGPWYKQSYLDVFIWGFYIAFQNNCD